MKEYNYLIIDAVNLGYKIFNSIHSFKEKLQCIQATITKKNKKELVPVYKQFIKKYIQTVQTLANNFIISNKELKSPYIYLLFDNYHSREEISRDFQSLKNLNIKRSLYSSYKKNRKQENNIFFNSLNFVYYYFLNESSIYSVVQIPHLEADDLVYPCIQYIKEINNKDNIKILLFSSDSDWSTYISDYIFWLPTLNGVPITYQQFLDIHKYPPSKVHFFKILNGDTADSIPKCLNLKQEEIVNIVNSYDSFQDFFFKKTVEDLDNRITPQLQENKQKLQSIYQLVMPVEISLDQFKNHLSIGRESVLILNSLKKLIMK